jgi:integrase/recombinase XerD
MVLLSFKAGLRACEIAGLTWRMVTDAEGVLVDTISLTNDVAKGAAGGRHIPMHKDIKEALALIPRCSPGELRHDVIVRNRRGLPIRPAAVACWFHTQYKRLGFEGASSHSGRRTFITKAARNIVQAGGALRDVQQLAGHASLAMTQTYIDVNPEAIRRVIQLV